MSVWLILFSKAVVGWFSSVASHRHFNTFFWFGQLMIIRFSFTTTTPNYTSYSFSTYYAFIPTAYAPGGTKFSQEEDPI